MPVSTRSRTVTSSRHHQNDPTTGPKLENQEESQMCCKMMRNPHHGLKEKMKELTLLYEQQKQASMKNRILRVEEPPSLDIVGSSNSVPNSTVTRTYVPPQENVGVEAGGGERIVGFSWPRRANRGGATSENVQESESNGGEASSSSSSCRILVFVRLRPLAKKEMDGCVRIANGKDVYLTEPATENDYLGLKRLRDRHFTFDASFPDSASQQQVYSTTTAELVEAVLQGRNGSVFCYGATGAGKTYTMLGTVENPGVMVLAIKDLFNKIGERSFDGNHVVHLSYLEIYNETVRDLLSPGRSLVLREDKQGIVAQGLTQYRAYSADEVMALLQQGNLNRTTEPTRVNETSSRSHAILQVVVEYRFKDDLNNIVYRMGKLSLIDLAGSERALATDPRTLRSLEGANINRSLLALSSCISALVEGKKHIPFRNSKLTQLLKDSLGGACNTVMIANISPSSHAFGETQHTLHWADRAKEIRTKAYYTHDKMLIPDSEIDQAKLLLELQKENRELRMQLARQQQQLLSNQAQNLAPNASPTASTVTSQLSPSPSPAHPNEKRKARPSLLGANCFTPESQKKGADETVKELRKVVSELEAEIERMKMDHALQIKQKDDFIHELSRKSQKPARVGGDSMKRVITRVNIQAEPEEACEDELKTQSHRFLSPVATAKKRTFWDIAMPSNPSLVTLTSRQTRNHVNTETVVTASKLLQPGFARQRP
ncbi:kinesin-like protein KIN-8A isoform X2 [Ipomoea triloba]|uniref:kinesin-like protein KIN-8A isoform X2 n=1 Tax=Ipomoea triloba TaxID=35885 RepID=UPI00125D006D|nr:kinesin-like protein KIN-8A isoform X2 [Ipomoea triloba]